MIRKWFLGREFIKMFPDRIESKIIFYNLHSLHDAERI